MQNPIFTIEMEDGGKMTGELYPQIAPNSVANFVELANSGFYDGVIFHRVIPGFMIQGGDPQGVGIGGPGYSIRGEFSQNGFKNDLRHTRGVLSMARSMMPDSAGSQFFIMVADAPHLDGAYAAFGKVTQGMEVADAIVAQKRDRRDKPVSDQRMKTGRDVRRGVQGRKAAALRRDRPVEKIKTTVKIAGKEYTMVGTESEEHIRRVAVYVDRKMEELALTTRMPQNMVAVLTAMNIADDLLKAQDENTRLRKEIMQVQQQLTAMRIEHNAPPMKRTQEAAKDKQ